jgi:tRNA-2-methylthio-N6-dimethylallyladenosine synthase
MSTRKLYIETYGCQMNVVDSEVVAAILQQHNYQVTEELDEADLVLAEEDALAEAENAAETPYQIDAERQQGKANIFAH